jgi:hypothetical protein
MLNRQARGDVLQDITPCLLLTEIPNLAQPDFAI